MARFEPHDYTACAGINDLNIYVYRIINRHPNSLVLDVLLPIRAPCVGYANIDRLVHIYIYIE